MFLCRDFINETGVMSYFSEYTINLPPPAKNRLGVLKVVSKVVGRKDLDQGMSGRVVGGRGAGRDAKVKGKANDPYACLPVDEQNIRMAELQSLGVDLSKEKLLLLLRSVYMLL